MFQKKYELFKELPTAFGIAEHILFVGYNRDLTYPDEP